MPLTGGFLGLLALSLADGVVAGLAMPALTASAVDQGKHLGAGMGEVMSLFTIGLSVGVFCGPVMGGAMVDFYGLQAAFLLSGIFSALGAGLLLFLYNR